MQVSKSPQMNISLQLMLNNYLGLQTIVYEFFLVHGMKNSSIWKSLQHYTCYRVTKFILSQRHIFIGCIFRIEILNSILPTICKVPISVRQHAYTKRSWYHWEILYWELLFYLPMLIFSLSVNDNSTIVALMVVKNILRHKNILRFMVPRPCIIWT